MTQTRLLIAAVLAMVFFVGCKSNSVVERDPATPKRWGKQEAPYVTKHTGTIMRKTMQGDWVYLVVKSEGVNVSLSLRGPKYPQAATAEVGDTVTFELVGTLLDDPVGSFTVQRQGNPKQ